MSQKPFDNLAATSSGRIHYDEYKQAFDPYQTHSQVRKQEIQKEKGFQKWKDNALFRISKMSGIQKMNDSHTASTDRISIYAAIKSTPYYTRPVLSKLDKDVKNHIMSTGQSIGNSLHIMGFFAASLIIAAGTGYGLLEAGTALKNGPGLEFQLAKRQFRNAVLEKKRVRKALLRDLYHPPEMALTEEDMTERMENNECGICVQKMNEPVPGNSFERNRVLHCKDSHGLVAPDAVPHHLSCLETWRFKQWQTLRGKGMRERAEQYSQLFSMPCPHCMEPMVSEELLRSKAADLAPELVYPQERSFREFAMDKLVTQPLSKLRSTLLRPRGYLQVPENAGMELLRHPHAE